jgi:hypothetical protein
MDLTRCRSELVPQKTVLRPLMIVADRRVKRPARAGRDRPQQAPSGQCTVEGDHVSGSVSIAERNCRRDRVFGVPISEPPEMVGQAQDSRYACLAIPGQCCTASLPEQAQGTKHTTATTKNERAAGL